jgi:hypothetical protein
MVINMRYYLVTIAAIFLALGIGIFIGFSLDGQEIFVEQQQSLISELEYRFNELRDENTQLRKKLESTDKELALHSGFINQVFPSLVEDKLQGLNVAIIESSDGFFYAGLITSLKKAGASVPSVTFIKKGFVEFDDGTVTLLEDMLVEEIPGDNITEYLCRRLVNAIITQKDAGFVSAIKKAGLIEVSGEYNSPVDYFIIAGGSSNDDGGNADKIDVPIITAIKDSNIPVIGVEDSGSVKSYIPYYKNMKISTVDNIDSLIGQYSMVMIMLGNNGHFGIKETADALIPDGYSIR